jgi:hypothetical protein
LGGIGGGEREHADADSAKVLLLADDGIHESCWLIADITARRSFTLSNVRVVEVEGHQHQ